MKAKGDYPRVFFSLNATALDGETPQSISYCRVELPSGAIVTASDIAFLGRSPDNLCNFMGFLKSTNLRDIKTQESS